MANQQPDLSNESIQRAEHIDPATTGDNIAAKKAANYVWDGVSSWVRMTQGGSGGSVSITDGTNTVNVLKSDGTAAGQNAALTAGTHLSVSFTTITAQAVGTTDVANYAWVSVHVVTQGGSSTVNFQGSNDNTNWVGVSLTGAASTYASNASTTGAGVIFSGPLNYRYFRLNVTGIASGTTAGVIEFFTGVRTPSVYPVASATANTPAVSVSQSGTWTVGSNSATGSAVPANAFYIAANGGGNVTGVVSQGDNADGVASSSTANRLVVVAHNGLYNGATWDLQRSNITGVVIAAGATGSNAGVSTTTYNASKAIIIVNISAFTSGSLTVAINGITSSGYSYPILTSAALAAAAVTPLRIFPSATPTANAVANDMVPRTLQVVTTVTGTLTYGIDYELSI